MIKTLVVDTKQDKDAPSKKTTLKVEYPDNIPGWLVEGYNSFLVVKLQGSWRNKGIPAEFSCKAQDYAPGTRHSMTPEEALQSLLATPAGRAQVQAMLAAKK